MTAMKMTENTGNKFSKLKKVTLSDQIASQILDMINCGTLSSGEKLPSERDLSETLGVSRLSLREALKSLQTLNVLSLRSGAGYYINNLNSFSLLQSLSFDLNDTEKLYYVNLRSARIAIEVGAVEQACSRRTEEDIETISACLETMRRDMADKITKTVDMDSVRFHSAIIASSKNPIFIAIFDCLQESLLQAKEARMYTIPRTIFDESYRQSISEHTEILKAIIANDAVRAKQLMEVHLRRSSNIEMKQWQETPVEKGYRIK